LLNIDEHICELLYDHDCVIVPALGGFLASNVQARLNPGQHTILPPRRKIAFNIYLRQNDGLLANHLVEFDRVSYTEALKHIDDYVQNCFSTLDKQRKVVVERVGTIYYDKEKHLLFEPFRDTQFRKDSFGLGAVQFLPVERGDSAQRIEQQRKEISRIRPSVKQNRKSMVRKILSYKFLSVLAIAGTLLWFSVNLFLIKPGGGYLGSLNPFDQDTGVRLAEKPSDTEHVVQKTETVLVASTEPVITSPDEVLTETTEIPVESKTEPVSGPVIANAPSGTYKVIAGVFKIESNAEAHLKTLNKKGYKNSGITRKGKLNYVSFNSFEDRRSALAFLDSLRQQKEDGWIWSN
jgi:cell division septation protein DedD